MTEEERQEHMRGTADLMSRIDACQERTARLLGEIRETRERKETNDACGNS